MQAAETLRDSGTKSAKKGAERIFQREITCLFSTFKISASGFVFFVFFRGQLRFSGLTAALGLAVLPRTNQAFAHAKAVLNEAGAIEDAHRQYGLALEGNAGATVLRKLQSEILGIVFWEV